MTAEPKSWTLVLDASIAGGWLLGEQQSSELMQFLLARMETGDLELLVPGLFFDEVLNVLLKAVHGGRMSESSYRLAWEQFLVLETNVRAYQHSISVAALMGKEVLARKHNLRSYDTNYLLLTLETGSRLATLDDRLIRAARLEGCYYEL